MSTLLLSLLLLLLIAVGLIMGKRVAEQFENPQGPAIQAIVVSPTLKNMMTTSHVPVTSGEQTPLAREQDLRRTLEQVGGLSHLIGPDGEEHWIPNFGPDGPQPEPHPEPKPPAPKPRPHPEPKPQPEPPTPGPTPATPPGCPSCPICPDMSQYIRLDEVPCWNCTLP